MQRYFAQGFTAVEMKIGSAQLGEDIERDCKVVPGYVNLESAGTAGFVPYAA